MIVWLTFACIIRKMDAALTAFLAKHTPTHVAEIAWYSGAMPLRAATYLTAHLPMLDNIRLLLDTAVSHAASPGGKRQ